MNIKRIIQGGLPDQNSVKSSFLALVSGTALAQLVTLLFIPILSRLYEPSVFGLFASFTSVATIIGAFATGKFEQAVILPKSDKTSFHLVALAFACIIIVCTSLILIGELLSEFNLIVVNTSTVFLLASYIFLFGLTQINKAVLLRFRDYYHIANSEWISSFATNSSKLALFFVTPNQFGLIFGALFGQFASLIFLARKNKERLTMRKWSLKKTQLLAVFKKYSKFPLFNTLISLLGVGSVQIPILLLAVFFEPSVVGYFSLSLRIVQLPVALVTASVTKLLYRELAAVKNDRASIMLLLEKTIRITSLASFFPFLMIALFGESIFRQILGVAWGEAGIYAQYFSTWIFLVFVCSPITQLYVVIGQQSRLTLVNLAILIFRLSSICAGYYYFNNPIVSIFLFALSGIVSWLFLLFDVARIANIKKVSILTYTLAPSAVLIVAQVLGIVYM